MEDQALISQFLEHQQMLLDELRQLRKENVSLRSEQAETKNLVTYLIEKITDYQDRNPSMQDKISSAKSSMPLTKEQLRQKEDDDYEKERVLKMARKAGLKI